MILKSTNPKIELRHVKLSDAKVFFECEQDSEAKKNFMSTPKSVKEVEKSLRDSIKKMKKSKPEEERFAIIFEGKTIGEIWIDELNQEHMEHKGSIGYKIIKEYRGKGIGSKAIKLVTGHAFKKYKLKRIWCFTRDFNIGSRKALEKAGYKLEGVLKKNKKKNGKYLNDCIYARVR
ncbi:MAG: GNAT family N-acetyltransferase [Candidatus Heimdallarchaeaceae archaeon]